MPSPLQIDSDFIVLSPDKRASIEKADKGLYERLDQRYNNFAGYELVACHEFESDWPGWEIHPHGDEIVMLLSGAVTFVLEREDGEERIALSGQGQYLIVPKGVWHTAEVTEKAKVLFVTPGEGTQHRQG